MFALSIRVGAEDKIGMLSDLLKPATVESIFATYRQITRTMKIHGSDLEILKCLLTDPRMPAKDITKVTLLSSKTVARRLEKMRENHILEFSILTNLSSTQLKGYIHFAVLINIDVSRHRNIVERIYAELQEYLLFIQNGYQKEVIFAVFFCANISTVNSVLRSLESYDGVNKVEFFIYTSLVFYQNWLKREIDKEIRQSSSAAVTKKIEYYIITFIFRSGMKVSWQVTGIRKDPWAISNPIKVEEEKSSNERGGRKIFK